MKLIDSAALVATVRAAVSGDPLGPGDDLLACMPPPCGQTAKRGFAGSALARGHVVRVSLGAGTASVVTAKCHRAEGKAALLCGIYT